LGSHSHHSQEITMKFAAPTALALALVFGAGSSLAADATTPAAKPLTPQQQKMSDCAKDAHAKGLKGDDYKAFMSTCTKGDGAATSSTNATGTPKPADKWVAAPAPNAASTAAKNSQQEKMTKCSADASAKNLKGDDRKAFMSTCLKSDSGTPAAH
jgi:psiF repeat